MKTAEWKLVAPWYHWPRQLKEGFKPRETRPVLQMFERADFAKDFVKEPQHSLKFQDGVDQVFAVNLQESAALKSGPFAGKFSSLFAVKLPGAAGISAKSVSLAPTGTRKLYLETHKRYYAVVCELHCDVAGFPKADSGGVCQAGFVIRRRSFNIPPGKSKEAVELLRKSVAVQAEIARLEKTAPAKGPAALKIARQVEYLKRTGQYATKLAELNSGLTRAREALRSWKDASGIVQVYEGWVPGSLENVGSWEPVQEEPPEIHEMVYPLYPVFADPKKPEHTAAGKTIYFGVVPTSSLDTDPRGQSRFDDESRYEIRCFVRRHKPECPPTNESPDCTGSIFWSKPSEVYKLASHNDLIGTSRRPVSIQMPNLTELAAQVAAFRDKKFSQLSPVRFIQPQGLQFSVDDGKPVLGNGGIGPKQICFFALPLITIVAFFVLQLFLPIVVFLFGLYFLLALRFCIVPSIEIDAGLDAELAAVPPGINLDVDFDASLNLGFDAATLNAHLKAGIAADAGITSASDIGKLDQFSNEALMPVAISIKQANDVPAAQAEQAGPDVAEALEYEERLEVRML